MEEEITEKIMSRDLKIGTVSIIFSLALLGLGNEISNNRIINLGVVVLCIGGILIILSMVGLTIIETKRSKERKTKQCPICGKKGEKKMIIGRTREYADYIILQLVEQGRR